MKNKDVIKQLNREAKVPDILDKIKADPNFYVPEPPQKRRFVIPKLRYAFMSLILLLAIMLAPNLTATEATITVDINPSVEFDISKKEKVLRLKAMNEDGEKLIEDIKYKGKLMNDVLDSIIEEAVVQDYINEDDYILIGVESENSEFSDKLTKKVNEKVIGKLKEKNKNAEVIIEKILKNKDKQANEKVNDNANDKVNQKVNDKEKVNPKDDIKLTDSKRNLIEEVINVTDYTLDDLNELATWKIKDLYDILKDEYINTIIDITDYTMDDYKKLSKMKPDKLLEIIEDNQ